MTEEILNGHSLWMSAYDIRIDSEVCAYIYYILRGLGSGLLAPLVP